MDKNWIQVTPSEFAHEQEALAFLKRELPSHDPFRAWANFEFIAGGAIAEVDTLVVTPKGIYLIEIKSHPGVLEGDAGTWRITMPGRTRPVLMDNPLLLANRKAKRLKGLLERQKAFRGERIPFVRPLVFLSNRELDCRLPIDARDGIVGLGRNADDTPRQRGGLAGVVPTLVDLTVEERDRLGRSRIDRTMARRVAQALDQAGIRQSQSSRRVGGLDLGELLDDGAGYQDFDAVHPQSESVHRRVRVYSVPDADPAERALRVRAARREFDLLHQAQHPAIARALDFHETDLGPALVFDRDPTEVRLDHYLDQEGATLTQFDRLALMREIAEAVASAHGRRLYHRALSPRSILVAQPGQPGQRLSIINWQTGARGGGDTGATVEGTLHVADLLDLDAAPYIAPEALTVPDADPQLLDVFSLGAVAYHVFTGKAPATTLAALTKRLMEEGALEVSSVLDGAGEYLSDLVRSATQGAAAERLSSVAEFLDGLVLVEDDLTAPDEGEEIRPEETSPLEARKGTELAGYAVEKRLGRGSTAIALLVTGSPEGKQVQRVLKIAADPADNDRIRDEGEVLSSLRDRTIIEIFGEPIDVAGHAALVLAYAGEDTLATHLHRDGRLGLQSLEHWGEDLLAALAYLERMGIPHRDIKPENLGVMEVGPRKQRRLVLMDFSLARAPADQLHVGTRQYHDPFLGSADRPRWDLAADRFAAALVLHEMAAGTLPQWGARGTDPRFAEGEAILDRDAFPREVAAPLAQLLERALRRDASERFDTADDLLRAWMLLFAGIQARPEVVTESSHHPDPALYDQATFETPVVALGLSARAANALEGEDVHTVADLLRVSGMFINTMRGVGVATRRELIRAQRALRARLGSPRLEPDARVAPTEKDATDTSPVVPLAELVAQLVPRRTRNNSTEVAAIERLLALVPDEAADAWPSQTEVARALDVTPGRIGQIAPKARRRWRDKVTGLGPVRDRLVRDLEVLGGVASVQELVALGLADNPASDDPGAARLVRAATRAATEVELADPGSRLVQRRTADGRVLFANAGPGAQELLAYALRLGDTADRLAEVDTLVGPAQVAEVLRSVAVPAEVPLLGQERLVALAAAASCRAAASARLEIYPRGLSAARALSLGRAALLGIDTITPDDLARRIQSRFPAAETLPPRPRLDQLLAEAGLDLTWREPDGPYVAGSREPIEQLTNLDSSIARRTTASVRRTSQRADPAVTEARSFEQHLTTTQVEGGLVVLMAYPRELGRATIELQRLEPTTIDLDVLILRHLHLQAEAAGVSSWEMVLRADAAAPDSADWTRLMTLVARAMPEVEAEIAATPGTVLLINPGLLARYGELGLVDRLRARIAAGGPLRACWLLVLTDDQQERPMVDGRAVPVLGTNEWTRVPRAWLHNDHRAAAGSS